MKAIQVSQTGGPEMLVPVDLPAPKPKANEAVVQLKAAGVNFIDVYFREGRYPVQVPFVNGQEGAGVVTEVGSDKTTDTQKVSARGCRAGASRSRRKKDDRQVVVDSLRDDHKFLDTIFNSRLY